MRPAGAPSRQVCDYLRLVECAAYAALGAVNHVRSAAAVRAVEGRLRRGRYQREAHEQQEHSVVEGPGVVVDAARDT